jgi:membrane protein DedA with SNARE-associated domain
MHKEGAEPLPHHHRIANLIHTYGYWGLFGALALEYLFIPVPGETTLTASGIFWKNPANHLHLFWLLAATTLGTFAGTMFGYVIGRTLGRPFLERFGRYIRLTPARIDKADALFSKYTLPTLVFSRYIAGIRIIVPYIAGINQVRLLVYVPVMLVSSLAWTSTFILAGSVIEAAWKTVSHHWKRYLVPVVIVVIILGVGYYFLHRWLHRKFSDHPDTSGESTESDNPTDE